jgi:hypothetical protein
MFEHRVLGEIHGPQKEEVTGGWRKLHTQTSRYISSPNITRMIIWRTVTHVGEKRNMQRILVRKPETMHLVDLGTDGRITVKWILNRMGEEVMDWIHLAQDRDKWQALVDKVMDLQVP